MIIDTFIPVNGTGTIEMVNGHRDIFVYGYFKMFRWFFIVHTDPLEPEFVVVSEASTGRRVKDEWYESVEDALYYIVPYINEKQTQFSTKVGDILVSTQCNLKGRNTTNLQTIAIDSLIF